MSHKSKKMDNFSKDRRSSRAGRHKRHMRISLFCIGIFFLTGFTPNKQYMVATIAPTNGAEHCAGYGPQNMAHVSLVSGPPIPVPPGVALVYTWYSEHQNGNWTWWGNVPTRVVPMPFPGQYNVQLKIEYIRKGRSRPFAAFWSNRLQLQGIDCRN